MNYSFLQNPQTFDKKINEDKIEKIIVKKYFMIEKVEFENKFLHLENALKGLKEAIVTSKKTENNEEYFSLLRDSTIQRFEYTYELSWKFMKYLLEKYDNEIETRTPAQVMKSAFKAGYIDDLDKWFKMTEYRNKTSHEYSENIAIDLYSMIPGFSDIIQKFYELIKIKYAGGYFEKN